MSDKLLTLLKAVIKNQVKSIQKPKKAQIIDLTRFLKTVIKFFYPKVQKHLQIMSGKTEIFLTNQDHFIHS